MHEEATRRAVSDNRSAANLVIGSAHQLIGDVAWARSHGLAFYHQTLAALAEGTQVPLPQAAEYRALAQETTTARQAALDAATEAYAAAFDAYQAAGARDRLARVESALREVVTVTSGGSRDLGAAAGFETEEFPGEVDWPAGQGEGASTPQEALAQLAMAAETADPSLIDLFYTETDRQRDALAAVLSLAPASNRFTAALKSRFGAGAEDVLDAMQSQAPGMGFDLSSFDPHAVQIDD
jgi:hypothetical protein